MSSNLFHPRSGLWLGAPSFHTAAAVCKEAVYLINGQEKTRSQVEKVDPLNRTVAEWQLLVDWDLHRTHNFIIVDPLNPETLLYLNRKEYLAHWKICASNELQLILVADQRTARPVPVSSDSNPHSQNSPWGGGKFESKWSRNSKSMWKTFLLLRQNVAKVVNRSRSDSKMVSETKDSIVRTIYVWASQLAHYVELKNPEAVVGYFDTLTTHYSKILQHNGQMALVLYLKVSLFALYSYIAGNPLSTTVPAGTGIRLTNGLPSCWPKELRKLIREGNLSYIRLMASLLNCYKAMEAPHKPFSVDSIVQPHPPIQDTPLFKEFQYFCKEVWTRKLTDEIGFIDPFLYRSELGLWVSSAGANNTGCAMGSLVRDAHAWMLRPDHEQYVVEWFDMHNDTPALNVFMNAATELHCDLEATKDVAPGEKACWRRPAMSSLLMATRDAFSRKGANPLWPPYIDGFPTPILGRLHAIDEPAGKVRVVAICDYWTQLACKPVHKFLFEILSRIGTDATFDQSGRVEAYYQKGLKPHWSFDLKSATDTIPTALYLEVLAPLLKASSETLDEGRTRVALWLKLLTDREWLTPDTQRLVRYGTGQPMGALSSWASMAIVHHALVQFSHWRSTGSAKWFKTYLVLGDDVDIAKQQAVATQYQACCDGFKIVIGLVKSLRSNKNVFEFANRRFCEDGDISPLSLKEELSASTWARRLEYAKRILSRYGSKTTDEPSALLRKVATRAQWKVLIPEISKLRPSLYSTLVRYCLLNPFTTDSGIDTIIRWLASVHPEGAQKKLLRLLASPAQRRLLESSLIKSLYYELINKALSLLSTAPKPYMVTLDGQGQSPERLRLVKSVTSVEYFSPAFSDMSEQEARVRVVKCQTQMDDIIRGNLVLDPEDPDDRKGSPFTLLYVLYCVNNVNEQVRKRLMYILSECQALYPSIEDQYNEWCLKSDKGLDAGTSPLATAIDWWQQLSTAPSFCTPDFSVPLPIWAKNVKLDELEEERRKARLPSKHEITFELDTIKLPFRALKLSLMRNFGIVVAEVPYIRVSKGGNWSKSFKWACDAFQHHNASLLETMSRLDVGFAYAEALETYEHGKRREYWS